MIVCSHWRRNKRVKREGLIQFFFICFSLSVSIVSKKLPIKHRLASKSQIPSCFCHPPSARIIGIGYHILFRPFIKYQSTDKCISPMN